MAQLVANDPMIFGDFAEATTPAQPEQSPFSLTTAEEGTATSSIANDPMIFGDFGEGAAKAPEAEFDVPMGRAEGLRDLPTPEKPGEYVGDWLDRMRIIAREGTEAFASGLESLAPGGPESIWTPPREGAGTLERVAKLAKPLGIIGGPVDVALSPASALLSQIGRAGTELQRKAFPGKKPYNIEEWAPPATALIGGGRSEERR